MNSKIAILATAMGLALVSGASADTPIVRITGATSFRSSVHAAIQAIMTGETYAYVGTSLSGATQANFTGTVNGQVITVETSWSGSGAGIQTVAGGLNVTFLKSDTPQSVAGTAYATAPATEVGIPDMAMSDVYQASTPFTSPQLTDQLVCVAPFVFLANDSAPAALTNVTPGLIQSLYFGGALPLALFTGASADETSLVYGLGRDPDSGSRITAMAEAGLGAFATVLQYSVTVNGDTISAPVPFPKGTSIFSTGNNGYSSGGTLAGALAGKSNVATNAFIGYTGIADAVGTAIPGGARALTWNGVAYSPTAVQEGQYSFWGYEHLFYKSTLAGTALNFANALQAQVGAVPGAAGLTLESMRVSRLGDGAPIGNDY
ncbi:MAG: hypothetical protein JWO82_2604 [Akkermansiaceae bacterium]|nr:hypothetical protein [Akkermansiaceae bacterium]